MYAIVEIKGKQFKVQENDKLYVPYLSGTDVDDAVSFDRVLLVASEESVHVGKPTLKGVALSAKVLGHVKADKVLVFKKRRRKHYKVKNGHRQQYTQIQVEGIALNEN